MGDHNYRRRFAILVLALAAAGTLASCSGDNGKADPFTADSEVGHRDPGTGLQVAIPSGWHQVGSHNLPGATIPLQVASFETERRVTSICRPGKILDEMPTDGVLLQILDNSPGLQLENGGPGAHSTGTGTRRAFRANYPRLQKPVVLGKPVSYECGSAYNLFFRLGGHAYQARIWTSPTGLSDERKRQAEDLLSSLRLPEGAGGGAEGPAANANRLGVNGSKVAFGRKVPFVALDCPTANSYRCDRVFFFIGLNRPAIWLDAWVGGRRVSVHALTRAPGSEHAGEHGYGWSGTLQPAGMMTPGSPLEIDSPRGPDFWAGRPPVRVDIKVRAGFRNGRVVTEVFRDELLAAGHG